MKLKEKIEKLIVEAVLELNKDIKKSELHSPNKETKLYGGNATLDSLSLVGLIVDVEERISDEGLIELHLESYQNDLIKLLDIEGFALISKKQIQEAI